MFRYLFWVGILSVIILLRLTGILNTGIRRLLRISVQIKLSELRLTVCMLTLVLKKLVGVLGTLESARRIVVSLYVGTDAHLL